ncbi:uncharacterized protein LOC121876634 [Homarus americanus]|uniref:uncharacterized protein LOC121876634 n=1 Tax=Homarus americanus TaxID=6706 RepID=UPI001C484277|nr:uncharacterized protein LOC121876634 [Homarus americanus]
MKLKVCVLLCVVAVITAAPWLGSRRSSEFRFRPPYRRSRSITLGSITGLLGLSNSLLDLLEGTELGELIQNITDISVLDDIFAPSNCGSVNLGRLSVNLRRRGSPRPLSDPNLFKSISLRSVFEGGTLADILEDLRNGSIFRDLTIFRGLEDPTLDSILENSTLSDLLGTLVIPALNNELLDDIINDINLPSALANVELPTNLRSLIPFLGRRLRGISWPSLFGNLDIPTNFLSNLFPIPRRRKRPNFTLFGRWG